MVSIEGTESGLWYIHLVTRFGVVALSTKVSKAIFALDTVVFSCG